DASPMPDPTVELLYWRGCPSWRDAVAETRAALAEVGRDPDELEVREVRDEDEARAIGFPGSPTSRVGGADIAAVDPAAHTGLTCRVYRRRDGHPSPLPDPEDLR